MTDHTRTQSTTLNSFHQFSKLADELQLMIWEYTWPDSRVLEAAFFDNPEDEEEDEESEVPYQILNLRLAGRLSTVLQQRLHYRSAGDTPVERCPDPIALHVCHKSRIHTLKTYRLMPSLAQPFYYHPRRDIFFLTSEASDEYREHMPYLMQYHGSELDQVETILMMDGEWPDTEATSKFLLGHPLEYVSQLKGLKTIQILSTDMDMDYILRDGRQEKESIMDQAEHLRDNFPDLIRISQCTARELVVMDCHGDLY